MTISDHSKRLIQEASRLAWEYSIAFDELMHIVGCEIIVAAIKKCGSKSAAAKALKMHRNTLQRWADQAEDLGLNGTLPKRSQRRRQKSFHQRNYPGEAR